MEDIDFGVGFVAGNSTKKKLQKKLGLEGKKKAIEPWMCSHLGQTPQATLTGVNLNHQLGWVF